MPSCAAQPTPADGERISARRALADIERKISGIVHAIEDGAYNPTFKARLNPAVHYVDLYGNSVGGVVTMRPHSGLVLKIASQSGQKRLIGH